MERTPGSAAVPASPLPGCDTLRPSGSPPAPALDAATPAVPAGEAGAPISTCLKWGDDGELTPTDLTGILDRLCAHDPTACQLLTCDPDDRRAG